MSEVDTQPKGAAPRWAGIAAELRARIQTQVIDDGRELSDVALANEYGVSTAVVRQAVALLVSEGLLTRQRGRGTFINKKPLEGAFELVSLNAWNLQGHTTKIELLDCRYVLATMSVAAGLGVSVGDSVLHLKRLRLADSLPVTVDYRFIPSDFVRGLDKTKFEEEAIWKVLQRNRAVNPVQSHRAIKASGASAEVAGLLGVVAGSPVLENEVQIVESSGRIAIFGTSFYHPDRFIYRDSVGTKVS